MFKKIFLIFILTVGVVAIWMLHIIPEGLFNGLWKYLLAFGFILLVLALWFGFKKEGAKEWWE